MPAARGCELGLDRECPIAAGARARTPPAFLFHTADDNSVPVENSLAFFAALRAESVSGELHVFPRGRHGVGLAQADASLSAWPRLLATWLETMGFLTKKETR